MIDVIVKGSRRKEGEQKLGALAARQAQKVVLAAELIMV